MLVRKLTSAQREAMRKLAGTGLSHVPNGSPMLVKLVGREGQARKLAIPRVESGMGP
jgi:hypothetical protein